MKGIYIHIPFCKKRCGYCSFVSCTDFSRQKAYVRALLSELAARRQSGGFDTIYIGGGTPSTLYRGGLTEIISAVSAGYALSSPEITVECNPDSADDGFFAECADCGVNRVSLGLQTANDRLLSRIGRPHVYGQFLRAYERAKNLTENVSVDLMLGLPDQDMRDLSDSLQKVVGLGPKHVSLYALKVEEGTPLYKEGFVPDEDAEADMYETAYRTLTENGFSRYEVSNFAVPGFESRHNSKYWDLTEYLGFGVAAHSLDGGVRSANTENIAAYIAGRRETERREIPDDERREEYIMLRLRTHDGIDLNDYRARFGRDLLFEKKAEIDGLVRGGFLCREGAKLALCEQAFYVMNSVVLRLL